jgi:hypothetical protein
MNLGDVCVVLIIYIQKLIQFNINI